MLVTLAKQEKVYIRKENDSIEFNSQGSLNLTCFFFDFVQNK